jgi:3-phytase
MPLWLDDNRPVSGLPNDQRGEIPVTLTHQPLANDPNGLDPEAIVRDQDGSFWLAEEYGPSLVHFSSQGVWQERFIPQTTLSPGMQKTSAVLPVQFAKRRLNRGFEALVRHQNKLFAFLQSSTDKNSRINLILEFDTTLRLPSAVYEFEMPLDADKISDAVAVTGQTFFAIVSDSKKGKKAKKYIIKVDLSNASNALVKSGQLASTHLVLNLVDKGFDYSEKAEGLAIVDNNIIVVNDNDFEVAGPQATEFLIIPWEKL